MVMAITITMCNNNNDQLHDRRASAMVTASMFATTESVSTGDQSHLKLPNVNSRSLCGKYDLSSEFSQPFVSNIDNVQSLFSPQILRRYLMVVFSSLRGSKCMLLVPTFLLLRMSSLKAFLRRYCNKTPNPKYIFHHLCELCMLQEFAGTQCI